MAATKILSTEDANLSTPSIIVAVDKPNSDLDLTFSAKPNSGDVYKKIDAAAVKQSIKNLLMTNRGDRPFNYYFGANLVDLLFELDDDDLEDDINQYVVDAIKNFEPRAELLDVMVRAAPNTVRVRVEFMVKNTQQIEIVETTISRLR